MNLTVGPLPPAVYWRRRVIVLVAVLALVLLVVAMCNGSGPSTASVRRSGSASPTPASPTPATTPSVQNPIVGAPGGPTAAGSGAPASVNPPPATSTAPASDLCADAEMQLTPSVQKITGGTYPYQLNLRIRNVSARTCKRDVGAGPQELHIVNSAGQTVWSSDNCQSGGGSDVRSFGANIEASFSLGWDGAGNTAGCASTAKLPDGNYQIVAKLDTKVSAPVAFTIGAAGK